MLLLPAARLDNNALSANCPQRRDTEPYSQRRLIGKSRIPSSGSEESFAKLGSSGEVATVYSDAMQSLLTTFRLVRAKCHKRVIIIPALLRSFAEGKDAS